MVERDKAPEYVELSRAEQAIVDILTQYYLEELEFDPYSLKLTNKKGEILFLCEDLDANIHEPFSFKKHHGYARMFYLFCAQIMGSKLLKSDVPAGLNKASKGLWEHLEQLGLATLNNPSGAYTVRSYQFTDLSKVDWKSLELAARTRAQKIITNGKRERAIAGIREVLSTRKIQQVLD